MRIRAVTEFILLSACGFGALTELPSQGGPRASTGGGHRVSVVVPVIVTLVPPEPGSPDQAWRVRTNDPNLRKRLALPIRQAGDTVQVTLTTP